MRTTIAAARAALALCTTLEAHAQTRTLPDQQGTQWQPYLEWNLQNPTYDTNPFDVEATAVFTHPESGERITTGMFYDGDFTWKFRFTGVRTGRWTLRTLSDDPDLAGWTGEVMIAPNPDPHANGFMKAFGSKWGWQGSERVFIPQYVMGKEIAAYLDDDGRVLSSAVDADIQEFVEEHGFTGFHLAMDGQWFQEENPDPRIYGALEEVIRKVHSRGGACHLWLWGSGADGEDGSGPAGRAGGAMSEMDRRNLRYLAARLGPVPGWSMGYAFDTENGWASREELDQWKSFLEERMGWDHFLGARVGYDEKGLFAVSPRPPRPPHDAGYRAPVGDEYTTWLGGDYTGYTSYRPLFPRYLQVLYHRPEKPSFEEDRFRLRDREEWSYKDYSEDLTRRGLWHSAMAGGVANIWGNLLPSADQGGSQPYRIKEQIRTYSLFFAGRFLREMMPVYDGPELRLASPDTAPVGGAHLLVYREDTDIVRLDLSRARDSLPAVAVDAKAPYHEIDLGRLSPGTHTWTAPYRSDWAIAVGDFRSLTTALESD